MPSPNQPTLVHLPDRVKMAERHFCKSQRKQRLGKALEQEQT
jgi:hypothetical protein